MPAIGTDRGVKERLKQPCLHPIRRNRAMPTTHAVGAPNVLNSSWEDHLEFPAIRAGRPCVNGGCAIETTTAPRHIQPFMHERYEKASWNTAPHCYE